MSRRGREDTYYKRAKQEGYAARSAFKLADMDKRYRLLSRGQRVLDLGCHPGSWLQYTSEKVGDNGLVVGVDLKPPSVALPQWVRFIQGDVLELTVERLRQETPIYDIMLSDVAPKTTGVRFADAAASQELVEKAMELAFELLKPGGSFAAKIYGNQNMGELVARLKGRFEMAKAHKPPASKSASREIYLLGCGFKPA